ncbi:VPLPA-CTERM sorting domain-containing protein [Jannaschia formosa]|uniref:VPLPA-CTERM sorting domain-containing protein n=1 Tax=Jannaschia formosa TaxID=2259592 RepID=UPI001075089A|nr:VPLPA-CTERM sorting domain-containing protein [Jannaschia formosa]TFL18996.1 VPLPA-CTERM sorting domain-containing protein [Jannaschia formosa]
MSAVGPVLEAFKIEVAMSVKLLLAAGAAAIALAGSASAATVKLTETGRDQVAGTIVLSDPGAQYNLGTVTATESAAAYGRVFASQDSYNFQTTEANTEVNFVFGGLALQGGGTTAESGLLRTDPLAAPKSVLFTLLNETAPTIFNIVGSIAFDTPRTSGNPTIFGGFGPGNYQLLVSGQGVSGGVLYDLEFSAAPIPLPASVLLLLGAIGGLGVASRRKKA